MSSPATNSRTRPTTQLPEWRWPLQNGVQRIRFLAAGMLLVLLYITVAVGDYASKALAGSMRPERLSQAIRIQPMNAAFHHLLGRVAFYERQDLAAALAEYQRATQLNRYSARYWLDLANTQQVLGLSGESQQSLGNALAADPTNPQVASEAANYYLVLGDTATALRLLGITVRHSPENARKAVELSWRATQDAHAVMEKVVPQTAEGYLLLLQILMERQQIEPAAQVWHELLQQKQPIAPEMAFPYIQFLIDAGEVARARSAWDALMRRDDRTSGSLAGDLVSNGGFEEDILNGGFGWRYDSGPHVALAIDQRESYRAGRSLSITFDGEPVQDAGIYQYLAVEAGAEYRLSARVKTEGLEGAGGPQLAILERSSRKPLFLSGEFSGTSPWQPVEGEFRTEADTKLVMLRVVRIPGTTRVRGRLWIDEVSVVRK